MQDKVKGTQQASRKYFFTYSEYTRNIKKKKTDNRKTVRSTSMQIIEK